MTVDLESGRHPLEAALRATLTFGYADRTLASTSVFSVPNIQLCAMFALLFGALGAVVAAR